MFFWWFMFINNLLIPVIMIALGNLFTKHCPKEINGLWGYRSARSMKNKDTWKFAHAYMGRLYRKLGWILLVPTVLVQLPFYTSDTDTVGIITLIVIGVQVVALLGAIVAIENALKRHFDADGNAR